MTARRLARIFPVPTQALHHRSYALARNFALSGSPISVISSSVNIPWSAREMPAPAQYGQVIQ